MDGAPALMERVAIGMLRAFHGAVVRTWLMVMLAMTFAGGSLVASIATGSWHWLSRSGALVVAIGAILSTRPLLREELTEMIRARTPSEERPPRPPPDLRWRDRRACFCGFWLVAAGTLIWAYGDLLGCLAQWSSACLAG